jgi:hypothetical protein
MKRNPKLNTGSVTTGVSKTLNDMPLKSEEIRETAVGRPYRLYKP